MFTDPRAPNKKYPKLKGRGAEIRNLGEALLALWSAKMDARSIVHKQVRLALKASVAFERIIAEHKHSVKLPPAVAAELVKATDTFVICAYALQQHFLASDRKLFNVTIKFHYLCHLALSSVHLNPRLGWCYVGEDYMGKIKKVASSCLRGTPPHLVSAKIMRKYTLGLHMRLQTPAADA